MANKPASGPRSIALIGPYSSGKTTLLENLLSAAGAISRKGTIKEGNTVGDSSPEARSRNMSVEISTATFEFGGETFTILDCPGSIELLQESLDALVGVDAAVVVCEADADRAVAMTPLLRFLDVHKIPFLVFVNKMDRLTTDLNSFVSALGGLTQRPLALRQLPLVEADEVTGYVDVIHRRGHRYASDEESTTIDVPEGMQADLEGTRTELLEALADFDDTLLERLLEDDIPSLEEAYENWNGAFGAAKIAPVLIGAAESGHGVHRLLKSLRHDVPENSVTAARVGLDKGAECVAQVLKTYHTASSGKMSLIRIWCGALRDGASLNGQRVASVNRMVGQEINKLSESSGGDIVALGRMDGVKTGDILSTNGEISAPDVLKVEVLAPIYAFAVKAESRQDEVKLSDALQKLVEEDRSLSFEADAETHQMLLRGQGEIHLQIALARARTKYSLPLVTDRPAVPYKETIRKPVSRIQGRHKKQSGGHGQFGDVFLDIKPLPRGSGFEFHDKIAGGVVPKQYIPAVQNGVAAYCERGPLGFPVVDLAVTLVFGSYHAVDSSELAFTTAGRLAMGTGMPQCSPVLLEPVYTVHVHVPNEFTPYIQRLLSGRRGQISGFEAREGWQGWDSVSAQLPQVETHDLIIELRSLTRGVGSFDCEFDRLQELTGKLAEDVVAARTTKDTA
ncbi:MAG TPA: elongation factor G [Alphaproteobacteria bacterium]|nr:elongation factor G [Alphaproteobacteria bacterium]